MRRTSVQVHHADRNTRSEQGLTGRIDMEIEISNQSAQLIANAIILQLGYLSRWY